MQPYTEAPNNFTTNIDISTAPEIVKKLAQCDAEMFQPNIVEHDTQSLYDDGVLHSITAVANAVKTAVRPSELSAGSMIVMSGCGTSGRIAFFIAKAFNKFFGTSFSKITYTIAGGDKALFTSQEAPEDDQQAGVKDLLRVSRGKDHVVYIGITCGLSAPYVAGQLDYCMKHLDIFTPVLLGFNPVHLARNVPIVGWDKTFRDVAKQLESLAKDGRGFIINPVLLGEAITGSSRMKGGSMTKIILETIFLLSAVDDNCPVTSQLCKAMLSGYAIACRQLYGSASGFISSLVQSAGESLTSDGHVYQISSNGTGMLGIIDATECPPTYGASVEDIRGFIVGGYSKFGNAEGDIGHLGEEFRIDASKLAKLLESPTDMKRPSNNTVIVVSTENHNEVIQLLPNTEELGKRLKSLCGEQRSSNRVWVIHLSTNDSSGPMLPEYITNVGRFHLKAEELFPSCEGHLLPDHVRVQYIRCVLECCAKWMFNGISTGAHVLKGKVFKNYMVDLKVSNQKLFFRSVGIIAKFCPDLSEIEAQTYLVRSIHEVDRLDEEIKNAPISFHILTATPKDKVVPTAIVMAAKKCTFAEAADVLSQYPVIRDAIAQTTQL